MPVFSVLIPVYNSEKYLQECINSVLEQTFSDFEIILVDDGSTDNSANICDKFSVYDKRIKIIHQKNQGPLISRITAFKKATGNFIIYMDSDDYWNKNLLEEVNNTIQQYNCDIVSFRWQYVDFQGNFLKEIPSIYPKENVVYDIEQLIIKFFTEETENSLWKRAVRKSCIKYSLIESLSKIPDIYFGEDMIQSFIMIKDCKNMVYLDKPFYYYRMNTKSLTHQSTCIKSAKDIAKAREYLRKLIETSKFAQTHYKKMLEKSFLEHYLTDLVNIADNHTVNKLKETAFEIMKLDIYKEAKKEIMKQELSQKRRILYTFEQLGLWKCFWIIARIYKKLAC